MRQVNRTLVLTQIENNSYQPDCNLVNLREVIETVSSELAKSSPLKPQLSCQGEGIIRAEQLLCQSIIENILLSALTIAPNPATITMQLQGLKKGQQFTVTVPILLHRTLVEEFFQKFTHEKDGLPGKAYSAQQMARLHGGDLILEQQGETTQLRLTLLNNPTICRD